MNGVQIIPDGEGDIRLGGYRAGVLSRDLNVDPGRIALGTDITNFTGTHVVYVGKDAAAQAAAVSNAVFVGWNAATFGVGDGTVAIGSEVAKLALPAIGGESVVVGDSAAPSASRIFQSVVLGRRTASLCTSLDRAVVVGTSTEIDSPTCTQVTAIGSNLNVRSPAIGVTVVGSQSTVGGTNSICLGSGNETGINTSFNVCIGNVVRAFGNRNIFIGTNLQTSSIGSFSDNILLGHDLNIGSVSNVTSLDARAYPGVTSGVTANTLYLGGCLRWGKLTGNLTFRAGGVTELLMTPASSLAATPVSVINATPQLTSLYSGMVTVTDTGFVDAKKVTTDEFEAGVMKAATFEATGLMQAKAGLTVTGALLAADATCTTLTATGLVQAQAGLTASGTLAANAGATCTTLTATNLIQAQGGLTVTGAALAANAGATCTTLIATSLVQAQAGLTVTGDTIADDITCDTLEASAGVTVSGVLTANAGTITTSLEASQLVQAKAGLTVSNGTLTGEHVSCTTLQASHEVDALSSVTVTGALTANGGFSGSTVSSTGLMTAQNGLTVSAGTLNAGHVAATSVATTALLTAGQGAVVNGGSLTANEGVLTTDLAASGTVTALQIVATDASTDFGVTTVGLKASGLSELADVTADDVEASSLTVNGATTLAGAVNASGGLTTTNLTTTGIFTATGGVSATGPSFGERFIVKIAEPGPQLVGTQAVLTTTLKATQRSDFEEVHAEATTVSSLTVNAGATLSGDVTSSGPFTVHDVLTVNGDTELNGDATVDGDVTVNLDATLKGDVTAEKNLVANRLVANGVALTSGQYALHTTTLRASGDAAMAKLDCAALTATGTVLAQNGLDVSAVPLRAFSGTETTTLVATAMVTADAGIETTTLVASDDAFFVDVDVSGTLTVSEIDATSGTVFTLAVTDDAFVEGDLVVTGSTTMNDLDAQATKLDSLSVTNLSALDDLTVAGSVQMFGAATVSGATTMYQTLTAFGLVTANAGLTASDVTTSGNVTATGTVAGLGIQEGTGVATVNRLVVNGVSLSATPTQQYSIEGTTIKATTINTSGACEVERITVYGLSDPFVFTTLNGFTGTPSINSVSLETGLLKATTVIATSLSTGSGPVSTTGTMTTNALVVTVAGGSTWTQALIDPTTTSGLRFSVGASRSVDLSQAYSPTDGTRKAFCSKVGTGFVAGALVSATGSISTYVGTSSAGSSAVSQDASVPEVELATYAGKERYVGVVSSIETGSSTERSQAYGSLVFRTPKMSTDERVVVSTSGFGAVLVNSQNGPVAVGDLLCVSNTAGQATKQTGDAVTSWTVGKAMQAVSFGASPVLVACKLC